MTQKGRAWLEGLALAALVFACLGWDLAARGGGIARPSAALTGALSAVPRIVAAAQSVLLWSAATAFATTRWRRAGVALALAVLLTGDSLLFRYYHAPFDRQIAESAFLAWADVRRVLRGVAPTLAGATLAVAAIAYALLAFTSSLRARLARAVGPGARAAFLAGFATSLVVVPVGAGTMDTLPFGAVALVFARPSPVVAGAVALPTFATRRAEAPNVLFILTESVRASDWCGDPAAPCEVAPETHALTRDRVALGQMRAVSSYTAVSFTALTTGRSQGGAKEELARIPTLFDFLPAARTPRGERIHTAYLSSQSRTVFEREEVRRLLDVFVSVEDLVGHEVEDEDTVLPLGVDRLLATRCEQTIVRRDGPSFTFVHFAGTHAPYFVDPAHAPFSPWERTVSWSKLDLLHRAYRNAIFEQDRSVARCVRAFLAAQGARPWAIVFTSDHGEAFGEHGAIHHGQGLHDAQIHVPAWILTSRVDDGALRARAADFTTHLDLAPTVLDLYGALGSPFIAKYTDLFPGASLLGPRQGARPPLAITNCTAMFRCPVNTWGVLGDGRALLAQPWDTDFRCTRLPGNEPADAADPACAPLRDAAGRSFDRHPNGTPLVR